MMVPMWIIILVGAFIYLMGMFGTYMTITEYSLEDFKGIKIVIPYAIMALWPLAVAWVVILIIYDATIGNYLWKRAHRKWVNEKDL